MNEVRVKHGKLIDHLALGKRFLLALFVFVVLIITSAKHTRPFNSYISDQSSRMLSYLSSPVFWCREKIRSIEKSYYLIKHSDQIIQENEALKLELYQAKLHKDENNKLRKLLNFKDNTSFSKVSARIMFKNSISFNREFLISIGSKDGIKDGNVVTDGYNLLGRVTEVRERTSKVQLINDQGFKVPVSIGFGAKALVEGRYGSDLMEISFLNSKNKVKEGDIVFTSGEGFSAPYGLYLGHIVFEKEKQYVKIGHNHDNDIVSVLKTEERYLVASNESYSRN